jgi:DNA-binding IclR family transcriptional regulator
MDVKEVAMSSDGTWSVVKSADRTLEVLEHLAASPVTRSLREISDALRIPRSSLHGLLRTMQNRGWVDADKTGTRFWIGPQSLMIGASYLAIDHIVANTSNLLDSLSLELGETIHLGVLKGTDVMYLAKRDAHHSLRLVSAVGMCVPAHATALGKLLMSDWDPATIRQDLHAPFQSLTSKTLTDFPELEVDLQAIRDRGYAIDNEESTEGVRCFAVALGVVRPRTHAISCSVPIARLDDAFEKHIVEVLRTAICRYIESTSSAPLL